MSQNILQKAFQDPNLSWKSVGLLAFLVDRAKGENVVRISLKELAAVSSDGVSTLNTAIKELVDHDYLTTETYREAGRIAGTVFTFKK